MRFEYVGSTLLALVAGVALSLGIVSTATAAENFCDRKVACTSVTPGPNGTWICNQPMDGGCGGNCQPCGGMACVTPGGAPGGACFCDVGGTAVQELCNACVGATANGAVTSMTCSDQCPPGRDDCERVVYSTSGKADGSPGAMECECP